jgi:hypothetical protein
VIRFVPDSLLEAVVRPIAMAVPAAGIYVETIAPDFRFVFALVLALAWLAWRLRAREGAARTLGLLAFCALAFVPWLVMSGNGRYFMPVLLVVGPLCIALLHQLPLTRGARAGLAGLMVCAQAFLLLEVQAWNSWGMVAWREPPVFAVDVPQDLRERPATYLSVSNITYSLIAPRFHPDSRWMNISTLRGLPPDAPDVVRARRLLQASPVVHAIFPSLPGQPSSALPESDVLELVDLSLGEYQLQVDRGRACRLLNAPGLTGFDRPSAGQQVHEARGFWLCPVTAAPKESVLPPPKVAPEIEAALNRIEQLCPRLFPPGSSKTAMLTVGARRFYAESDMRLYVLNDGQVVYKYLRALNPVALGHVKDVAGSGFRMDCNQIRGRSGLPWEREI